MMACLFQIKNQGALGTRLAPPKVTEVQLQERVKLVGKQYMVLQTLCVDQAENNFYGSLKLNNFHKVLQRCSKATYYRVQVDIG